MKKRTEHPKKPTASHAPRKSSPPPPPAVAEEWHAGKSHDLVGSDVLDEVGTGGVAKRAMHDVVRTPDDEVVQRHYHHYRNEESATVSFHPDLELGDAAADLADEFGRAFLESATSVEDISGQEEVADDEMLDSEIGGPFIITETEEAEMSEDHLTAQPMH